MKKFIALFGVLWVDLPGSVLAQTTLSTISDNMIDSASTTPGVIAGVCYFLGLILGVIAILKLRQHVEDHRSTPLREPVARGLTAGALFALPTVYTAVMSTISGGTAVADGVTGLIQQNAQQMQVGGAGSGDDINAILGNILTSLKDTPGLFAAAGYLIGLVFGVAGIFGLKEHVQEPDRTPLRHGVSKLLVAGALFALTTIISAVWTSVSDSQGAGQNVTGLVGKMGISGEAQGKSCSAGAADLGGVICNLYMHTTAFPTFVAAVCYLFGIAVTIWGILKIRTHVHNPDHTTVWEGVSRLVVAGGFFALPYVIEAVMTSMMGDMQAHTNSGPAGTAQGAGLDKMLSDFMTSVFGPTDIILTFFGYAAGTLLVMIGISRLMKAANEGPRGPGGIGTIMTFVAGGALLSFSPMIAAFTMSLFGKDTTATIPVLNYVTGLDANEQEHIKAVISAMIQFVLLLGLVSFLRGIFIIRGIAEGGHNHSMMAGVTHLVGGAMAVNLGPFINAVETTLNLTQYGVTFQ